MYIIIERTIREREILYNSIFTWLARFRDNGQGRGLERSDELLELLVFERANVTANFQLMIDVPHEMLMHVPRGLKIRG